MSDPTNPKPPAENLNALSHAHPWTPFLILGTTTSSLHEVHASVTHHLSLLDCRGHDARDMQKTLNYITAELEYRDGNIATQTDTPDAQRMQKMKEGDLEWENHHGGNPKWGEGRRESCTSWKDG